MALLLSLIEARRLDEQHTEQRLKRLNSENSAAMGYRASGLVLRRLAAVSTC
jgi:hypothetical protein